MRERVWNLSRDFPTGAGHSPDTLTIRHRASVGEFVRPVQCFRSFLTVIFEDGTTSHPYREALLNPDRGNALELRISRDEIHPSEVALAGRVDYLWDCGTVAAVLRAGGAQEQSILPMLQYLGLMGREADSPRTLTAAELKRLSLASSFYNRSSVVLFDRPLHGIDAEWYEPMAHLLVEVAKVTTSFVIVVGEDRLPECWLDDDRVRIDDTAAPYGPPVPLMDMTPPSQMALQLFQLGGGLRSEIVTRPIPIPPRQARAKGEALKSEAIPNLSSGLEGHNEERPAEPARIVRPSGPLTKVSMWDHLRRHPMIRDVRALYREYLEDHAESMIPPAIPLEKRLIGLRNEWFEKEIGKGICLILVIGVVALAALIIG